MMFKLERKPIMGTSNSLIRIGFLFIGKDVYDRTMWSGTITNMFDALKNIQGIQVVPIGIFPSKIFYKLHGISKRIYKGITKKEKTKFLYLSKILSTIILAKAKVRHCNVLFAPIGIDLLASVKTNHMPIIYLSDATCHALYGYYWFDVPLEDKKIYDYLEKRTLNMVNKAIYSSQWAANDALTYYNADENVIKVMEFGPNLPSIMQPIKRKYTSMKYNLLLCGVDWNRKGIDIAIECVTELNHKLGGGCTLHVVGCDERCKNKWTIFHGFLNKNIPNELDKINSLYEQCNIFILPTKAECAGIVFAEAAMYSMPIFTYETGGISNYVLDGVNGRTLPLDSKGSDFAKAIIDVIETGKLNEYSIESRKLYENKLNWNCWTQKFNEIIYEVSNV